MGTLKSVAANAGLKSTPVRLDRDTHTLLIRRLSDKSISGALRTGAPESVAANIRDRDGNYTDTIKRATLGDLVAFGQYFGAAVQEIYCEDANAVAVAKLALCITGDSGEVAIPTVGKYLSFLPIRLTASGRCVTVLEDEDHVYNIGDLLQGAAYDFIALEGESSGTNYLFYEGKNSLQDQHELPLDVDNMQGLVLPSTLSFERLLVTYGNQRTSKFTVPELKWMSSQHNAMETQHTTFVTDEVKGTQTVTVFDNPLTSEVLVMPLAQVTRIEIETDGKPVSLLGVYERSRQVK